MKISTMSLLATVLLAQLHSAAHAAPSSAARMDMIRQLPDWSGIWQVTGNTHYLSGDAKNQPSFTPQWRTKNAQSAKGQDTAQRFCAIAVPRLLAAKQPFELIVTPEETLVNYSSREIRHLWTDGRDHPLEDERWPMYWAETKGAWQLGATPVLVVESINVHGDLWIDATGATLSDEARMTERISQVDATHLKNEVTITDPKALTKPFTFTRSYEKLKATELEEQNCQWTAGQAGKQAGK